MSISSRSTRKQQALLAFRLIDQPYARELGRKTGLSESDYEILHALAGTRGNRIRALDLRQRIGWEKSRLSSHRPHEAPQPPRTRHLRARLSRL